MSSDSPPPSTLTPSFAAASLEIANAIGIHWFGLREFVLLDFIRRQSFGAGRHEAYIPGLHYFVAATRISKGNVATILRALRDQRVIEERPQWFYGFILPPDNWKVPIRLDQVEVINQLSLIDEPGHLRDAMRATFVDGCNMPGGLPGSPYARTVSPAGGPLTSAPETGVPDSGTPAISSSRSRFGNGSTNPVFAGHSSTVPDSGTDSPLLLKQCKNGTDNISSIVSMGVPDSGTDAPPVRPPLPRGTKFTRDQQDLFDECRRLGAFAADGDPVRSKGCWYDMVVRRPETVRWLLSELRSAKVARVIENPGGFMMQLWKSAGRPDRGAL